MALDLPLFQAKLAQAKAGTGTCHVLCAGDSITAGLGVTDRPAQSYPTKLLAQLVARAPVAQRGTGLVTIKVNPDDARWALQSSSQNGFAAQTSTTDATFTFTPGVACTQFTVYFQTGPSSFGTFEAAVDGTPVQTVNSSTAFGIGQVVIPAGTSGLHVLTLRRVTGLMGILGASADAQTTGLQVSRMGYAGDRIDTYYGAGGTTNRGGQAARIGFDLALVMLQSNDAFLPTDVETYKTRLQGLVTGFLAGGGEVVLMTAPYPSTPSATVFDTYKAKIVEVVNENAGVRFIDIGARFGGSYNAALMADSAHPNDAGYVALADEIADRLLDADPVPPALTRKRLLKLGGGLKRIPATTS